MTNREQAQQVIAEIKRLKAVISGDTGGYSVRGLLLVKSELSSLRRLHGRLMVEALTVKDCDK